MVILAPSRALRLGLRLRRRYHAGRVVIRSMMRGWSRRTNRAPAIENQVDRWSCCRLILRDCLSEAGNGQGAAAAGEVPTQLRGRCSLLGPVTMKLYESCDAICSSSPRPAIFGALSLDIGGQLVRLAEKAAAAAGLPVRRVPLRVPYGLWLSGTGESTSLSSRTMRGS